MEEKEILSLASLLHDIGKFFERTGVKKPHQEIGYDFLNSIPGFNDVSMLVKFHHNPDNLGDEKLRRLAIIIQFADWLSSSERKPAEYEPTESRVEQGLVSIFNEVFKDNVNYDEAFKFCPSPLRFDEETVFPRRSKENLDNQYERIREDFIREVLPELSSYKGGTVANLLSKIEKYFWAVPSATHSAVGKNFPDISLYDHSKITSAIALSLYEGIFKNLDFEEIKKIREGYKNKDESILNIEAISFLHGDFSGIQNFITNITSKYAVKSLKGRSAFLVILQRFIAEHILNELNLDLQNLLYAGGGHIYIIAPLLKGNELENIANKINRTLFEHFGLDLYLALGFVNLTFGDFYEFSKRHSSIWEELSRVTDTKKRQKFKELNFEELFEPKGIGGLVDTCEICGKEIINQSISGKGRICEDCESFINLAELLKNSRNEISISRLKDTVPILKEFNTLVKESYSFDFEGKHPVLFLPSSFPLQGEQIKSFDDLAKEAEDRTGTRKIGIFKADVDNLGMVFMKGLEKALPTLSRISSLSRQMSLFFEGYVNHLANSKSFTYGNEEENYSKNIYLIYAGGDDIFAIGAWDSIISFACKLNDSFKKYVCYNESMSLSGSIVITSPHTSVRSFLRESEEKLEECKSFHFSLGGREYKKNSINIFGETLMWNKEIDEFKSAINLSNDILNSIISIKEDEVEGRSRIQKIKEIISTAYSELKEDRPIFSDLASSLWHLRYFWVRNVLPDSDKDPQYNSKKELLDKINEILERSIFKGTEKNPQDIRLGKLIVALRLAELKTRENKN